MDDFMQKRKNQQKWHSRLTSDFTVVAALLGLFIGATVLTGWAFDLRYLKSIHPSFISMKANTALCFGLFSVSLLLIRHGSRPATIFANVLGALVMSLSAATLVEYLFHVDLGFDQFLFLDLDAASRHFPPGRLAPITAANFIFLVFCLISHQRQTKTGVIISQIFALLVLFASFQAIVGYAIGLTYLFGSAFYTQMALHTAAAFAILSLGVLFFYPERGIVGALNSREPTARMTRWLLFSTISIPPVVRWLGGIALQKGLYDQDFFQLTQVVGITALMAFITIAVGATLSSSDEEKKRLLQKERETYGQLQLIADLVPALIAYIDGDFRYVFANENYSRLLGKPKQDFLHQKVSFVMGEEFFQGVEAKMQKALQGESVTFEKAMTDHFGQELQLKIVYVPDRAADGTVRGFVALAQDITQDKVAQDELERAKNVAEVANLAKTQFLANMSHELRTPLGVITGFLDLLKNAEQTDVAGYMAVIDRNSQQLLGLISDILDLSKVEAAKIDLEKVRFSLKEMLRELDAVMTRRAHEKRIVFRTRLDPRLPEYIDSDPVRVRQILTNLVGNGIKFTDQGFVELSVKMEDSFLLFNVRDSGTGISHEESAKLFKPFTQADTSTTRRFGGTGLGLALTRGLCEAMGGSLQLKESWPGRGSIFEAKIFVPCAVESSVAGATEDVANGSKAATPQLLLALQNIRVLLVEDSPDNQLLVSKILLNAGARVETAVNGLEGIERATSGKPDIVLMDIQMPVLDGLEATRRLRAAGYQKPIVALTAHAMQEERTKSFAAGCDDHLTKPIERATLVATVQRLALASH